VGGFTVGNGFLNTDESRERELVSESKWERESECVCGWESVLHVSIRQWISFIWCIFACNHN